MDVEELIIYIAVAVIVGGLVLLVVGRFSSTQTYDRVRDFFNPPERPFIQVDNATLPPALFKLWESCGLGMVEKNLTFAYTGQAPSTNVTIFASIKRQNLCDTFSCVSCGCGRSEDLNVTTTTIVNGSVYKAVCNTTQRKIVVS